MVDLEEFYDEYVSKIYKFFYINCLDRHTSEDLTSKTFISFMEKADSRPIDDPKKYLYGIMRHVWMDFLRLKYKEKLIQIESIDDFAVYSEEQVHEFESASIKKRALQYIERLPAKQRLVAQLRLIEELSIKETAEQLGHTTSYIKTTQNRAIKSLKALLETPYMKGGLS
ncbi:sigma-70 family RNA polymerase sigma factor [Candidatus Saccharibacteria bacterium]|nr:sigma-70 family RNA polymerase sigma factor [Candidatus Saccharibacteria bacterium]